MKKRQSQRKYPEPKKMIPIGFLILFLLAVISMFSGRYQITPAKFLLLLQSGKQADPMIARVLLQIRLPRICFAMAAGGGLAVAGAAMQGIFGNPLATPDTLGVANGASFGAALAILLGFSAVLIQVMACLCGLFAIFLVFIINRKKSRNRILFLVLAGMTVGSFFSALLSMVKYVADPQNTLPAITYWLMGNMSAISWNSVKVGVVWILSGSLLIWLLRWRLNALALSEDEAKSFGLPVYLIRAMILFAASLITAAVVASCGQIGWIGLIVPHISRLLWGADYKKTIAASFITGAAFLLIMDTLARSLTAAEIPVAILTAIVGAPVFLIIILKEEGKYT